MLILGLECATRVASVGVVRAPLAPGAPQRATPGRVVQQAVALAEVSRDTGLAHGAELLTVVDECLARAGAALRDVGCIAVSLGPGSFTGLRVALATAKGLALGGDVALVGVSTLEALAATVLPGFSLEERPLDEVRAGSLVASCLDARKGEVYGAVFAVREPVERDACPRLERLTPDAAHRPAGFAALLAGLLDERPSGGAALLLGDGAERYAEPIASQLAERARTLPSARHHPRGATVARLGAGAVALSGGHDAATLVPFYARASEAEIARARKRADRAVSR